MFSSHVMFAGHVLNTHHLFSCSAQDSPTESIILVFTWSCNSEAKCLHSLQKSPKFVSEASLWAHYSFRILQTLTLCVLISHGRNTLQTSRVINLLFDMLCRCGHLHHTKKHIFIPQVSLRINLFAASSLSSLTNQQIFRRKKNSSSVSVHYTGTLNWVVLFMSSGNDCEDSIPNCVHVNF